MKTKSLTLTNISTIIAGLLLLTSCATVSDEPSADSALPSPTAEEMAAIEDGIFEITANPHSDVLGMKFFTKYVDVFGLGIYAEAGLSDAQVLHAAAILAELLDNDENGVIDDEAVLARLVDQRAIIPMFGGADFQSDESPAEEDFFNNHRAPLRCGCRFV